MGVAFVDNYWLECVAFDPAPSWGQGVCRVACPIVVCSYEKNRANRHEINLQWFGANTARHLRGVVTQKTRTTLRMCNAAQVASEIVAIAVGYSGS